MYEQHRKAVLHATPMYVDVTFMFSFLKPPTLSADGQNVSSDVKQTQRRSHNVMRIYIDTRVSVTAYFLHVSLGFRKIPHLFDYQRRNRENYVQSNSHYHDEQSTNRIRSNISNDCRKATPSSINIVETCAHSPLQQKKVKRISKSREETTTDLVKSGKLTVRIRHKVETLKA